MPSRAPAATVRGRRPRRTGTRGRPEMPPKALTCRTLPGASREPLRGRSVPPASGVSRSCTSTDGSRAVGVSISPIGRGGRALANELVRSSRQSSAGPTSPTIRTRTTAAAARPFTGLATRLGTSSRHSLIGADGLVRTASAIPSGTSTRSSRWPTTGKCTSEAAQHEDAAFRRRREASCGGADSVGTSSPSGSPHRRPRRCARERSSSGSAVTMVSDDEHR